ncbi:hypothetical protein DPMN_102833 [Dreissena polymorpha]|uniref:Thyroglobulin type-1 domain-containing protein n=2 Tax=Dreissena polymorpha TaxID=45954 RepID=A0A9D4H4W7_DREPO|nr:hypothetical protein DPMN_102833 [Dreissena polymorpha]
MLKIVSFVLLAGWTNAMINCPPDYCMWRACPAISNGNCNGVVRPKGGVCGCCDVCITQLAEGDNCRAMMMLGVPADSECASDLTCDIETFTCKRSVQKRQAGSCSAKLAEVEAKYAAANGMLRGLERPLCEANGDFKGMQYQGSQAFCVAPNGSEISGFMVNRWEAADMDCQCARDQYAYQKTGLIGRMFSCDRFGNYAPTGCTGSVCFCQDRSGKPIGDTRANMGQLDALNC